MARSRNSAQTWCAPMSLAAAAASLRRIAAISSGPCTVDPQSPGVMVTIVTGLPAFASKANVPPARISASSGCAWIETTRAIASHYQNGDDRFLFENELHFQAIGL